MYRTKLEEQYKGSKIATSSDLEKLRLMLKNDYYQNEVLDLHPVENHIAKHEMWVAINGLGKECCHIIKVGKRHYALHLKGEN